MTSLHLVYSLLRSGDHFTLEIVIYFFVSCRDYINLYQMSFSTYLAMG